MKKSVVLGMLCACAAVFASCSTDKAGSEVIDQPGDKVAVKFVTNAPSSFTGGTRAMSQIAPGGFRILAFRQVIGGSDYLYYGDIDTSDFTETATGGEYKMEGTAYLDYGSYKFVPTYGLSGGNVNGVNFNENTVLTNDLALSMGTGITGLPEIFLDVNAGQDGDPVNALQSIDIVLNGVDPVQSTDPVTLNLKRAVGRVDVYFVKGEYDENDNLVEVEMEPGRNVFGGYTNETMKLHFTNINGGSNYFGVPFANAALKMNPVYEIPTFTEGQTVIAGNAPITADVDYLVGGQSFANYDNIQPENIMAGGYYFVGPYFFGQQGTEAEATLSIELQNTTGATSLRNIPISTNIPVKRNMVTIVKVYVLSPHVYSTKVNFAVVVDTVWEDSETVTEILD